MDLRSDIACLRQVEGSKSLSPSAREAAERLLKFLDGVLVPSPWEPYPELPRGYYLEVMGTGSEGVCVPCASDDPGDQLAYFAADVATGWPDELCAAIDSGRAQVIRSACGFAS
jgi:hypothetical protein